MKVPIPGPGGNVRVWVLLALKAAEHLIPLIERELKKRWKAPNQRKTP